MIISMRYIFIFTSVPTPIIACRRLLVDGRFMSLWESCRALIAKGIAYWAFVKCSRMLDSRVIKIDSNDKTDKNYCNCFWTFFLWNAGSFVIFRECYFLFYFISFCIYIFSQECLPCPFSESRASCPADFSS